MPDFRREAECVYKGEHYAVRDNGEVLRHARKGKPLRKYDNIWTKGVPNNNAYMLIGSEVIHRIVAYAFIGEPPTAQHIVDHIDTNRQNNRPENLRWVTKFENALLNPITAKRIAIVCGSVEAFLADPTKFRDKFPEPNISWMCTVSKQEAQISLKRMLTWARSNKRLSGGSLGKWIFYRGSKQNQNVETMPKVPDIIKSKTLNAVQRNWRVPCEFPCCPPKYGEEPLTAYSEKLKKGSVFCRNDVYSSLVSKSAISDDRQSLFVVSESTEGENALKPWALAKITYENGMFVHTTIRTFFTQEGADKLFCLAQGIEWTGGDSIDDHY
ncbi:MAG: HNH endonuclease [Bacteroidales bacterium]|nr:HNH endonuclease [Bacteroidales bacterium]